METSTEKLFERFVRRGDVHALGQAFDRAAPELWVVAGHLARDSSEADDLVQATFLAAIEGAQRYDGTRPLVPWLVGILTRVTLHRRRQEGRSIDPGRLDESTPADPSRASEDEEFQGALATQLGELPEPYRGVLNAYLIDERKPREIASELGRPAGTVRVQLHRGLTLLRAALPPGFAVGFAATISNSTGLGAVRAEVLAHGTRIAATSAAGATSAGVGVGSSIATTRLVAFVALLSGALSVGWFSWRATRPTERLGSVEAALSPPTEVALRATDMTPLAPPEDEAPNRSDQPIATPRADVAARVEAPAARAKRSEEPLAPMRFVVLGNLRLRDLGPAELASAKVTVQAFHGSAPLGSPLPGLGSSGKGPARDVLITDTPDELGNFRLDISALFEPTPPLLLMVRADHPSLAPRQLQLDPTHSFRPSPRTPGELRARFDLELEPPPATISGTIEGPQGASVAAFGIGRQGRPEPTPVDEQVASGDGSFRLRVPRRDTYVVVMDHDERAAQFIVVEALGEDNPLGKLTLDLNHTVRGWVKAPRDHSPAGYTVRLRPDEFGFPLGWRNLIWIDDRLGLDDRLAQAEVVAISDEEGHFEFQALHAAPYIAQLKAHGDVSSRGSSDAREVTAPAGGLELAVPIAIVEVQVSSGKPIQGAHVQLVTDQSVRTRSTDEDGEAKLTVASGRSYKLLVHADGFRPVLKALGPLRPCDTVLQPVVLKPFDAEPARLVIELSGSDAAAMIVETSRGADAVPLVRTVPVRDGELLVEDLEPGSTLVRLRPAAAATAAPTPAPFPYILDESFEVDLTAGETTRHALQLREGARLRVAFREPIADLFSLTFRPAKGPEVPVIFVPIDSNEGVRLSEVESVRLTNSTDVRHTLDGWSHYETYPNLPPGTYRITTRSWPRRLHAKATVDLLAGETRTHLITFD